MKYNRSNPPWILLECSICIKTEHVKYNRMSPPGTLLELNTFIKVGEPNIKHNRMNPPVVSSVSSGVQASLQQVHKAYVTNYKMSPPGTLLEHNIFITSMQHVYKIQKN